MIVQIHFVCELVQAKFFALCAYGMKGIIDHLLHSCCSPLFLDKGALISTDKVNHVVNVLIGVERLVMSIRVRRGKGV